MSWLLLWKFLDLAEKGTIPAEYVLGAWALTMGYVSATKFAKNTLPASMAPDEKT